MSLKLRCALPVTLKSARLLIAAPDCFKICNYPIRQVNICGAVQQFRCLSNENKTQNCQRNYEKPKYPLKQVYYGPLAPHVRAVKLFSLSSSIVGLTVQPLLYKEIVVTGNLPIILAAYSFIGFFTVLTPLLLHIITRKYVTELLYNEKADTYIAKTFNLFCVSKEMEFKVEDVHVPDVPGMFVSFHIKGKPLFLDPRNFDKPEHYARLMGFDKPIDFKLFDNGISSKPENASSATTSSASSSNK